MTAQVLTWISVCMLCASVLALASARRERRRTSKFVSQYLDETHKFLALLETGAREEASFVLSRLTAEFRRWSSKH